MVVNNEKCTVGICQNNQYLRNNLFCVHISYVGDESSFTFKTKPTCTHKAGLLSAFVVASIYVCKEHRWNIPATIGVGCHSWDIQCAHTGIKQTSTIIKDGSLWHPETIKGTIRLCSWQGGTERSGRAIFGQQLCFCTCVCIHARGKPVDIKCVIPVEAAVMQSVTGSPWIIHRTFSAQQLQSRFHQIVLEKMSTPNAMKVKVSEAWKRFHTQHENWNSR